MTHSRFLKLCKPSFSMTLAAVTALSMSCLLVENQHRRITHLVLVRHLDEFFVCLLNPVSVVAVSGVDQASRQAKLKFLRPNLVMVVTISPSFSLKRIVVCLAASCSTIKISASVLPTKRSQIMVVTKPTATNTRRRASLCPVPPGLEFSPELSASFIPSDVAVRRCGPRSVVCQESSRTRSRPRHDAATAAAATAALLLLLCNGCLLIPCAVFLGALPSLNCYCADTYIAMHATNDLSFSLPLLSFVTSFTTHLHDYSDTSYQLFNLMPSSDGLPDSVRLGFVSLKLFLTWSSPAATNILPQNTYAEPSTQYLCRINSGKRNVAPQINNSEKFETVTAKAKKKI